MKILKTINVQQWLDENKDSFHPPVCNKLMHNEQLIVMFVGGPNQREDYHIEEGEELFYQLKGDMCVKIIENGCHKDVHIGEGEFFILPARVPHSPQRTAGSIGLVIERRRALDERDAVRWFVPNSIDVLYEKWFHCKDLGVELIPLIKTYFASDEYRTKVPGQHVLTEYPFKLNQVVLNAAQHGPYKLSEKLNATDSLNLTPNEMNLQFEVLVLKSGEHLLDYSSDQLDVWIWQLDGSSQAELTCVTNNSNEIVELSQNDSFLVSAKVYGNLKLRMNGNGNALVIVQNPRKKF